MQWKKKNIDSNLVKSLMQKFGCDALSASILARRNLTEGKAALYSLETNSRYLYSPFLFKNMEDAVDRILHAKDEGEKVLIFGDRDVDGITSTTVLYEALSSIGIDATWKIPVADEPYGLSIKAIDEFAQNDGTLIITVDCGISNKAEIDYANSKGIDVIITDHHKPQETIPDAFTIINPQLENSGYPLREISGCAVAWKLVLALRFAQTELYKTSICLLNVRPITDAYTIEIRKLVNLVEVARLTEHIQPGALDFSSTKLPTFLAGEQIFVWNEGQQKKLLEHIFGKGIEFAFCDLQPLVEKMFPQLKASSLLKLKDFSTIGKYDETKNTEIDAFFNIFITFIQQANKTFYTKELEEIQLVALSTISDLMPLHDENRMILKLGMEAMNKKLLPGLADILARQGATSQKVRTHEIGWLLAPVLNASGRMGKAELAVKMLLAKNIGERTELVEQLFKMNDERKHLGETCWNIILAPSYQSFDEYNQRLVVVSSDKLNRGISGILASRLVNLFNVPAIVMCEMPDNTVAGSCRSVCGFQILDLIAPLKRFFIDYGGHNYAAGFTIHKDNLLAFKKALKDASESIELNTHASSILEIDAELPKHFLTPDIFNCVDSFEPFGEGFPELMFMTKELIVEDADIVGKGEKKHLKLTLKCGDTKWPAMFWNSGDLLQSVKASKSIDMVYNISRNYYGGNMFPQLIVQDLKIN